MKRINSLLIIATTITLLTGTIMAGGPDNISQKVHSRQLCNIKQ